jgi:hypothetical protein
VYAAMDLLLLGRTRSKRNWRTTPSAQAEAIVRFITGVAAKTQSLPGAFQHFLDEGE